MYDLSGREIYQKTDGEICTKNGWGQYIQLGCWISGMVIYLTHDKVKS